MATMHEQKDLKSHALKSHSMTPEERERDWQSRRDPSRELMRRDFWSSWSDPFDAMRRFVDRLDRPFATSGNQPGGLFGKRGALTGWAPQIETFQRGDQFVVRADLPGLEKKDITVEIDDNALVIEGERSNEHEQQDEGYYASERSYGRFCRVVPLPEGAITDSVKASFKNGVLEIVTQAPPHEVSRGRKIDISEGR